MLLYRRVLAILLGSLLIGALLSAILFQRLDGTVLNPSFYKQRLIDAKFYEFILGEFLVTAIDEYVGDETDPKDKAENEGMAAELGLSTDRIARSVKTAVTSEWLRGQTEASIDEIIPYVAGDADSFDVNVDIKHQAEVLLVESKAVMRESDSYEFVLGQFVEPLVEDVLADESLFGINLSPDRTTAAVRAVVTEEWVRDQIDVMVDGIIPYLVGDEDSFTVEIPLNDRAELAIAEIRKMMREAHGYDIVYRDVVEAQVLDAVGESVELPGGLTMGREEAASILREVVTPVWLESQAEAIMEGGTDYLIGKDDKFVINLSLEETKARAHVTVVEVATSKVLTELESLPKCHEPFVSEDFALTRFDQIPECIPSDVNVSALNGLVAERVSGSVAPLIEELIPDKITFTNEDLRKTILELGDREGLEQFDQLREAIKGGWVYTEVDLGEDLSAYFPDDDNGAFLEDTRALIANGLSFTDSDLRGSLAGSGMLSDFEKARNVFRWLSISSWLLFPVSIALILGIGFLGGTTLRTRVVWGSGGLTIASLVVLITWGIIYSAFLRPQLSGFFDSLRPNSVTESGFSYVQGLLSGKIAEMFESSLNLFASGIYNTIITLLIVGLIVFLISYFWDSLRANYERAAFRLRQLSVRSRVARS